MITRRADLRGERALGLFLDKYFYHQLKKQNIIRSYARMYDSVAQKMGVDIELDIDDKIIKIDEKAQLYYIGNPRESFVVEISFVIPERGHLVDGWFMNTSNITDSYLFTWIKKADTDFLHRIISEDFSELEVYIVEKFKIKDYLDKQGFSDNRIRELAQLIRNEDIIARNVGGEGFHFSYTRNREELPINIVVEKRILEKLSSMQCFISKERIMLTHNKNRFDLG